MRKAIMVFLIGIVTFNIVAENKNIKEYLSAEQQRIAVVSSYIISGDFLHTKSIVNKKFDLDFSYNEIENILKNDLSEYEFSPLHNYAVRDKQRENMETDRFLREYFFENDFIANRDTDKDLTVVMALEKNSTSNTQLVANNNFTGYGEF